MARRHKPNRSLSTADYLARAVYDDLIPEHAQTCEDYGFNRAISVEEKRNLLGLYTGLIKLMEIPPKTIHDWRIHGVLVDEINFAYCKIPEHTRGAYFAWFLQNQHIIALAGQPLSAQELDDHVLTTLMRTWKFIGGSEKDSLEEIRAAIERKPAEEQKCYLLYTVLLPKWIPCPGLDLWVDFGFASCTSEEEEKALGDQYQQLITMCTFKEFCDAYRNRRLLDLFHSKGLQVNDNPHLRDLLSGSLPVGWAKSVWALKAFVLQEDPASMPPSIMVDYGFINCENASERQQLKKVYKDFFDNHREDGLALHEAAIQGNLYDFLSNILQDVQDPKFQRLMKNPYPLSTRRSCFSEWHISSFILVAGLGGVLFVMFLMRMLPL